MCSVEVLDYMENHAVSEGGAVCIMRRLRGTEAAENSPVEVVQGDTTVRGLTRGPQTDHYETHLWPL